MDFLIFLGILYVVIGIVIMTLYLVTAGDKKYGTIELTLIVVSVIFFWPYGVYMTIKHGPKED